MWSAEAENPSPFCSKRVQRARHVREDFQFGQVKHQTLFAPDLLNCKEDCVQNSWRRDHAYVILKREHLDGWMLLDQLSDC